MTIPEEAGKVATSTVEALKTNPSCLAAIILAGIFAVLTFFAMQRDADRRARTTDLLLQRCFYDHGITPPQSKEEIK